MEKMLSEVLTMSSWTSWSQFQETSTSNQSLIQISNSESNTYDDDDFKSGSHDNHSSSLDGSQESDSYEDPLAYSCKNHAFALLGLYTSDGL